MEHHPPGAEDFGRLSGNAGRILAKLLSATFPGKEEIAQQIAVARGRVIDADGSLELSVADAPRADVVRRIPVEAEAEDIDGMTFHVLLDVVDGYINELEIYRNDSLPVQGPVRPEALRVVVL